VAPPLIRTRKAPHRDVGPILSADQAIEVARQSCKRRGRPQSRSSLSRQLALQPSADPAGLDQYVLMLALARFELDSTALTRAVQE
jgi:hypothetical protein